MNQRQEIIEKCYKYVKNVQEHPENYIGVNAKDNEKPMNSQIYAMCLDTIKTLELVEISYMQYELMKKKAK